ncbi:MAG: hypothetical protein QXO75_00025 [Nitrososphaerota archaeon]
MQPVLAYSAAPGAIINAKIYLYNLYGTYPTHVLFNVTTAPPNWVININPPARNVIYEIPGGTTTIFENVGVEQMDRVNETPATPPEGIEYIRDPVKIGMFIPAKVVYVNIEVPNNAELWKTYDIKISASAWCTGGAPGTVGATQSRDFNFQVKVVPTEYYERAQVKVGWIEFLRQNAILVALIVAIIVVILIIFVLKRMGKLILKVELK